MGRRAQRAKSCHLNYQTVLHLLLLCFEIFKVFQKQAAVLLLSLQAVTVVNAVWAAVAAVLTAVLTAGLTAVTSRWRTIASYALV